MDSVMIVDDEPAICTLLESILSSDYTTASFTYPESAIDYLNTHHTDVVLCDLKMPQMDGIEVLKEIRKKSPGTQIVIMTAFSSTENALNASEVGAFDFLFKPFEGPETILDIVSHAVEHRKKWKSTISKSIRLKRGKTS